MNRKKNEVVRKESKEKSRRKPPVPKLKEEENDAKSVNRYKSVAHSGIFFDIKLNKPNNVATESRHEQVETSSLTKKNEPQMSMKGEKTISKDDFEVSMEPGVELCDTKSMGKSILHQCQGTTCKCSKNIQLLNAVCLPQHSTKSELLEVGKKGKESHLNLRSKSARTQQASNNVGKKEKTEGTKEPVSSELKPLNRRLSKLRPPSAHGCKPKSFSKIQHVDVMPQSTMDSIVAETQPKCVFNTGPSSKPTKVFVSEPSSSSEPMLEDSDVGKLVSSLESFNVNSSSLASKSVSEISSSSELALEDLDADKVVFSSEPFNVHTSLLTNKSVSEISGSPEPTLEKNSDVEKLVSSLESSHVHTSLPSSATAPDLADVVQSSDRPAFWPPSVPTYEIIEYIGPSSTTLPLSPIKPPRVPPSASEHESSKIPMSKKRVSLSCTSRIPKITQGSSRTHIPFHPATDTKNTVVEVIKK